MSSGAKAGPLGVDDSVDQVEACLQVMIGERDVSPPRAIRLCVCGLVKMNELAALPEEQQLDRAADFCADKYPEEDGVGRDEGRGDALPRERHRGGRRCQTASLILAARGARVW